MKGILRHCIVGAGVCLMACAASAESMPSVNTTITRRTEKVVVGPLSSRLDSIEAKLNSIVERLDGQTVGSRDTIIVIEAGHPNIVCEIPVDTPAVRKETVVETASAAEPAVNIEPFGRAIEQIAFVPKGQWIGGISVSYSQSNQDRYQFLIIENLSGDTYTFKVSPMVMFAFKNNLAAGARFAYSRSRTRLKSADIVLDSETGYNMENLYSINHSYVGTFAFRQYMSLGGSTRFGFFNEVQMQLGGGQSKICNGAGDDLTGTYSTNFTLDVGLAPGLIMFLSNYSALEVNVGVLGFNYTKNHFITDQIYPANMRHSSANFKINLFSITFGVAFYI